MKKCIANCADETGSIWNFFDDGTCRAACWNESVWDSLWRIENGKVIVCADSLAEDKEFITNARDEEHRFDLYRDLLNRYATKELEKALFNKEDI